jgi:hypothetical protein
MAAKERRTFGAQFKTVDLAGCFNWPGERERQKWWRDLAARIHSYPEGPQKPWGIPFRMGSDAGLRVALVAQGREPVSVALRGLADYLCLLQEWVQLPEDIDRRLPREGRVVAEYQVAYADGAAHRQPVRARFEVGMVESPGPAWLAVGFDMWQAIDPVDVPEGTDWAYAQTGTTGMSGRLLLYALPNPRPGVALRSLTVTGLTASPFIVAGLTLCRGSGHPLRHLPRRTYRVRAAGGPQEVAAAEVDLGAVVRLERTAGQYGKRWLASPYTGLSAAREPERDGESLIRAFGSEDATMSVKLAGRRGRLRFSLGEAFHRGSSADPSGAAHLHVLDARHQWMRVRVTDATTGEPTPVRVHMAGPRGNYIAPYGHHEQINTGWFMDYGADVVAGGRNFAYVPGEFTTDMPVGDLYVEICKGFEYAPVRRKVTIRPGQRTLDLRVSKAVDWRSRGWVTADTHVHFISPHTAALQAQAEGVNVVNLLASQWGRLFTNVGDLRGRVGVIEEDTIVYVGTENRNHMLGHMSMLGTKGLPVYPMCCGGPTEAWLGDPDLMDLAEWALENRRRGGVVIRPHYPYCGNTEDPVPIVRGLVDALEITELHQDSFPAQEWYRYLNCGYRVAVAGGTDKMGAYCPLGWVRTYALLDTQRPFSYDTWADAVRAGRTFATTGPLIDICVEGSGIGETVGLPSGGGTVEVEATAESVWPIGRLEVVHDGRVVARESSRAGSTRLCVRCSLPVERSGWLAARCQGPAGRPAGATAAHTSPVYLQCGDGRPFDAPAAQHMLALVEGSVEYMRTLATAYDQSTRNRLVRLFRDVQKELRGRLAAETHPDSGDPAEHGFHGAEAVHGPGA